MTIVVVAGFIMEGFGVLVVAVAVECKVFENRSSADHRSVLYAGLRGAAVGGRTAIVINFYNGSKTTNAVNAGRKHGNDKHNTPNDRDIISEDYRIIIIRLSQWMSAPS